MARTFPTGSTVGTTATVIFESDQHFKTNHSSSTNDGRAFKSVNFDVASASAVGLLVNIPWIHQAEFYPIAAGTSKEFVAVCDHGVMGKGDLITIKGDGGTATYAGGITA